jgi:uncharacterized protein YdaU (DUF1376 family)
MNYYEHHIGDYAEATAHLSCLEDGVYSRMIRKYYAQEKPLPADIKAVQRLIGARTKDEREAVETILAEFFELQGDGWHNARCDAEVARYQDKQAKAKRSAEARWSKAPSQSVGNANASPDAMRTHSEGNAHQTPDTKHHTPLPPEQLDWTDERNLSAVGALSIAMRRKGIASNPGTMAMRALVEAGVTPEEVSAACDKAKASKPNEAISADYVIGILRRQLLQAAELRSNAKPASPKEQIL